MMVTTKLGLTCAIQLRTLLLRRIQAVQELGIRELKELSQVSVLNAWALLKDTHTHMYSMMVTAKLGLISAIQHRTHGLRRIQVVQVLMKMKRKDLSQVSELNAKDLHKLRMMICLSQLAETLHGQRNATQVKIQ